MTYKAFQDWYHEAEIKHLLLYVYDNKLISPPFATDKCKDYSKVLVYDNQVNFIDLNLPPVTSKTNAVIEVDGDLWLIPYGIYDEFNTVVQLKDYSPIYHSVDKKGKGQFYSAASNGTSGFSFPLGYEETSFGLYIKNNQVTAIDFERNNKTKLHMGCIYCNGKFWSMPRSDDPGYIDLVSFDGKYLKSYKLEQIDSSITRKYTDLIAVDNILYSLPYGETKGLNEIIEFDTEQEKFTYYKIKGRDFSKKYNSMVLINDLIIGLPYGDEFESDSDLGIIFNTTTKTINQFSIEIGHGGKYRYRSGISFSNSAYFFPAGTPSCPIIKINVNGTVEQKIYLENIMLGRPVVYNNRMWAMGYNIDNGRQFIMSFDENLNYKKEVIL